MIAEQISSIFWLLHSDLHEVKVTSALEYLSSVVASVEPLHQTAGGKRGDLENLSLLEQNFGKGKLEVRFKRRNGRVRVVVSLFLLFSHSFFFGRVWWDVAPDYEALMCYDGFHSVFRMKDFISISQAAILHLFYLKMD